MITLLTVARARLRARLHLFAAGQLEDLEAALDELITDVIRWATFGQCEDAVDEAVMAWCRGGDAALETPRNRHLLDSLTDAQLDQLERRIKSMKAHQRWRTTT